MLVAFQPLQDPARTRARAREGPRRSEAPHAQRQALAAELYGQRGCDRSTATIVSIKLLSKTAQRTLR